MKKQVFCSLLLILVGLSSLPAQNMTKQQTLEYILRIYRKVNKFYLSGSTYVVIPAGIDGGKSSGEGQEEARRIQEMSRQATGGGGK